MQLSGQVDFPTVMFLILSHICLKLVDLEDAVASNCRRVVSCRMLASEEVATGKPACMTSIPCGRVTVPDSYLTLYLPGYITVSTSSQM